MGSNQFASNKQVDRDTKIIMKISQFFIFGLLVLVSVIEASPVDQNAPDTSMDMKCECVGGDLYACYDYCREVPCPVPDPMNTCGIFLESCKQKCRWCCPSP